MVTKNEIWAEIRKKYPKAERQAKEWLEKISNFKVKYWHKGKPSNKPYDILASKKGKLWAIEIKSGKVPTVKTENILKIMNEPKFDKIGLMFITPKEKIPVLFELNKMSHVGRKASKTKGKDAERKAGIKASTNRFKR